MAKSESEPLSNIFVTCPAHASKPDASLHDLPIEAYVGRWVKVGFNERNTQRREHLWVRIHATAAGRTLLGTIDNDPVLDIGYRHGDGVVVDVTEIEAIAGDEGGISE